MGSEDRCLSTAIQTETSKHQGRRLSSVKTGGDVRSLSSSHPDRLAWQSPPNEESQCERHLINARRATADRPETLHEFVGHTVSVSLSGPLPPCISVCVCVCVFAGLSLCVSVFLAVCLPVALCVRHAVTQHEGIVCPPSLVLETKGLTASPGFGLSSCWNPAAKPTSASASACLSRYFGNILGHIVAVKQVITIVLKHSTKV